MSKKCADSADMRRKQLLKAEQTAREDLEAYFKAAFDARRASSAMPLPVLSPAPEQARSSGGEAGLLSVEFTPSGGVVEDELVRAHDSGFRPGMKVVASPGCSGGIGGMSGIIVTLEKDGVVVQWEGMKQPQKHEASVIEALVRDPEQERVARADEAARKRRKINDMPPPMLWRSACEVWTMENVIDEVRALLYNLHVMCGSEGEDLRVAADSFGSVQLYAARNLKAGPVGGGHVVAPSPRVSFCTRARGRA